ncbi:MAG: Dyp-type peroxidase [Actinomycetota bacterium]|nr:Dyp-type peroxidase [Actinomycetota bacterium]
MSNAQVGLFAMGTVSHNYLEFSLLPNGNGLELIRAVANLEAPQSSVNGLNMVVGIRPSLWASLARDDIPPQVYDFVEPITGPDGFSMPATQRDLWVWFAASSIGQVFDASVEVIEALTPHATLEEDLPGWSYRQNRDLIGFIDGSANPSLLEAPDIALIPRGTQGENGSILLFQKWLHDLKSFGSLRVEDQEKVIGRTKLDSEEFEPEELPKNSHVARTTLIQDGSELPIFRRNTAYGTPTENGTVFVGFSKDQYRLHEMLKRMSGIPDGTRDALTYYSRPLTGSYYFVPSVNSLRSFADKTEFFTFEN